MNIIYARVSSNDQSLDIQHQQLIQLGGEKIFRASAKDSDRAQLTALLDYTREGDVSM
jgi:DNA invertase Pin-like site-specific DNA recombinase